VTQLRPGVLLVDELRKHGAKVSRVLQLNGPSTPKLPAGLSYSTKTDVLKSTAEKKIFPRLKCKTLDMNGKPVLVGVHVLKETSDKAR
jgi:hypothetical protein